MRRRRSKVWEGRGEEGRVGGQRGEERGRQGAHYEIN